MRRRRTFASSCRAGARRAALPIVPLALLAAWAHAATLPEGEGGAPASTHLAQMGRALGFRVPPRGAHARFLFELRRVSPERLVEAASRFLAAGNFKEAAATAKRAAAEASNPLDFTFTTSVRLRVWATSTLYAGQSLAALGDLSGASSAFRDLEALTGAMLRLDPRDRSAKQLATAGAIDFASVELAIGRPDAATTHYGRAKALLEGLLATAASERELQQTLASTDRALGELKLRAADVPGALAAFRAARDREAMLIGRNPLDVEARLGQARAVISIGDALMASKELAGAQGAYAEAQQILKGGEGPVAALLPWRYAVAESAAGLAAVSEARGDAAAAAAGYRTAREDFLALVPLGGGTDPLRALGSTNFHLANVLAGLKDTSGALEGFRDAIDAFTGLLSRDPADRDAQRRLVATFARLADLQIASGNADAAIESFQEARDILVRLLQLQPGNSQLRRDRAICDYQIGKLLAGKRDVSGALANLRDSLKELRTLLAAIPNDVELRRSAWTVAGSLGAILESRGDLKGALQAYRSGADALGAASPKNARDATSTKALTVSAERISSVGYMLILAHDFGAALAAEDDARRLAPDTPWIEANRAHALMLLGRTAEARSIYLRYRGEKLPGNVAWADGNRKDFEQMRKAGIASPLMDEVEHDLTAPR